MTKIFSDFHHTGLLHSLQLLFEGRLQGELYRPIGEEWFDRGFWHIAKPYGDYPGTITQFLGIRDEVYMPEDGSRPLNDIKQDTGGYYVVKAPGKDHKAVTLEQFKSMKFDIVIASIPQHLAPYTKLIKEYQPQAKLIYQIGNDFGPIDFKLVKNLMSSTKPRPVPKGVNAVFYHQEFDTDVFCYKSPVNENKIYSFVHCLGGEDYKDYRRYKEALPEFEFKSFGSSCDDGPISGWEYVAEYIHRSTFPFHLKTGGDGFGHIIHNCFACGRPPIVKKNQYRGKLAEELMTDGETCIDVDGRSLQENIERIRFYSEPERHRTMCDNATHLFRRLVNFDEEARRLRHFVSNLQ